jgi:hypothetical protein
MAIYDRALREKHFSFDRPSRYPSESAPTATISTPDFIEGAVSANYSEMLNKGRPVASSRRQIMARTDAACERMANKLVAIIFLE